MISTLLFSIFSLDSTLPQVIAQYGNWIFVILFLGLAPKLIEQAEDLGEPLTFDLAPPAPKAAARPKAKAQAKASKSAFCSGVLGEASATRSL